MLLGSGMSDLQLSHGPCRKAAWSMWLATSSVRFGKVGCATNIKPQLGALGIPHHMPAVM